MTARWGAIETTYRGIRFRSRTEARWAVMLDALGVLWEYEKEGYHLGEAGMYLPDFWLSRQQLWLEIKGQEPNEREEACAQALARHTERPVAIVVGSPREAEWDNRAVGSMFYPLGPDRKLDVDRKTTLYDCDGCRTFRVASLNDADWYCGGCGEFVPPFDTRRLSRAIEKANACRFDNRAPA